MLVDRKTQTYAHLNAATHLEVEGVNYYTINYKHQGGVISIFIKTLNIFKPSEFFLQALKQINKYMLFCYARAWAAPARGGGSCPPVPWPCPPV